MTKYYTQTVEVEKREVAGITSNFNDFVGLYDFAKTDKAEQWREAYFTLLSWKNTWGIPYEMDINSTRDHIPFVNIVVSIENAETLIEYMEGLGYGNIKRSDFMAGIVETPFDDDDECFDFYFE